MGYMVYKTLQSSLETHGHDTRERREKVIACIDVSCIMCAVASGNQVAPGGKGMRKGGSATTATGRLSIQTGRVIQNIRALVIYHESQRRLNKLLSLL